MPNILLPVPHRRQQAEGDCLAACAAMVLSYLGKRVSYARLLGLLRTSPYGTSGYNLQHLAALGVEVTYAHGSMPDLEARLADGLPCIALVRTADLPYWREVTDHAVVVVGLDGEFVVINDPYFEQSPQTVHIAQFELAWQVFDYRYAVINP